MQFKNFPSPYSIRRKASKVIFENEYTRFAYDLDMGGELSEAVVRFGSGRNLLEHPQSNSIALFENGRYHAFESNRCPTREVEIFETDSRPGLRWSQKLHDREGKELPGVEIHREVVAHEWGYCEHTLVFEVGRTIEPVGQVQIGSMFFAPGLDCLAVRKALAESSYTHYVNGVDGFRRLHGGCARSDVPAYYSQFLPLSALFFRRGLEGMELALGDDLAAFDTLVTAPFPMSGMTHISCDASGCLTARFCPVDSPHNGQSIQSGRYTLKFRISLPFVKSNITPLRPSASRLHRKSGDFSSRWPNAGDWRKLAASGVTLMRLHNDGDDFGNGIFWRDACYPPYPVEEMAKMDAALFEAAKNGIAVTPYFSCKEFHPEAPGYAENAMRWRRMITDSSAEPPLLNYSTHGVFGAQMCLSSDWFAKRRETIDETLRSHAFGGVYFDWCAGGECRHPFHRDGRRHWDGEELQRLLEWSFERVGKEGEVYLHLTHTPSLAAENLATIVLTEEQEYGKIGPLMFSEHVHFLNVAPRSVCEMLPKTASGADRRRLAMAALLHHATVSSWAPEYLEFYREQSAWMTQVSQFTRHTAPGEGLATTEDETVGMAAYWNARRTMLVFANFNTRPVATKWRLNAEVEGGDTRCGVITLAPLEFKSLYIMHDAKPKTSIPTRVYPNNSISGETV